MYKGTVIWFNTQKGYGSLRINKDGTKVFVHWTGLNMEGFKTLRPGQTVTFDVIETERGRQAVNVTVIEEEDKEDKS